MKKAAWASLVLGIAASAGPFRPSDVPAEAEWWLHLDLEQLKAT